VRLVLALAAVGCYRPSSEMPCSVRCDQGACPASLECGEDRICHAPGAGLCTPDASMPDAPADAPGDILVVDDTAPPHFALVQQTALAGSAKTLSTNFAVLPTPGNVMVMIGANNSGPLMSVVDGMMMWTKVDASTQCANTEIWYRVTDGSSTSVAITGSATGDTWMWIGELSGLDTTNLLDQHTNKGYNNGATTTIPTSSSITTAAARELVLFSAGRYQNSFMTPGPGTWTKLTAPAGQNMFLQNEWYMVTSATGTFAPSVGSGANCWDTVIASFRLL
jgi:hypothetical protein